MQFSTIFTVATALLFSQAALARPATIQKRLTCQACDIAGWSAGDACCSAHCLIEYNNIHGGHCDENGYCICN